MKPKKKHSSVTIKNFYPLIWKKYDDKIMEFFSLNVDTLKKEEARNRLEEHFKMNRLHNTTKEIEKAITKNIDKFLEQEKKSNEVT